MRKHMYGLLVTLCFSLLTPAIIRADDKADTVGYRGTFWSETNGSVGTLHYDFSPYGFRPDSIVIKVTISRDYYSLDTVYLPPSSGDTSMADAPYYMDYRRVRGRRKVYLLSVADDTGRVEAPDYYYQPITVFRRSNVSDTQVSNGQLVIEGAASFDIPVDVYKAKGYEVRGYYQDANDSTEIVSALGYLWENTLIPVWSFAFPGVGYYESKLSAPLNKENIFGGGNIAMGFMGAHWLFMFSSTWSGIGDVSFSQPFRTEYRRFLRTHGNIVPELTGGVVLSKIKIKDDDEHEFRKVKWGVDIGAAIKVPFYRLSYRYATAAGGYHVVDLYAQFWDDQRRGPGIHYTFQSHKELWTVGISCDVGLDDISYYVFADNPQSVEYSDPYTIHRRDNRPWPLKIITLAGSVPFLPYVLIREWYSEVR